MKYFTDAEIEQHRIELANALIEHSGDQIIGRYSAWDEINGELLGVCAVGCAVEYTGLKQWAVHTHAGELNESFEEYFGIKHETVVSLNEHVENIDPYWGGDLVVNKTFPEIADIVKNWSEV